MYPTVRLGFVLVFVVVSPLFSLFDVDVDDVDDDDVLLEESFLLSRFFESLSLCLLLLSLSLSLEDLSLLSLYRSLLLSLSLDPD